MNKKKPSVQKILVVDDDRQIRQLICTLLGAVGYEPLEAQNAVKAIDVLEKQHIDLMLLDINMVGASGTDLIHALQRRRLTIPIIIVSGFVSALLAKQLRDLGVCTILAKPFNRIRLVEEVRRVLGPYVGSVAAPVPAEASGEAA